MTGVGVFFHSEWHAACGSKLAAVRFLGRTKVIGTGWIKVTGFGWIREEVTGTLTTPA